MVSSELLTVKDEIEEGNIAKSKSSSPYSKLTTPRETLNDEIVKHKRYSLLSAPSSKFWKIADGRDQISRAVASPIPSSLRARLSGLAHKISWDSLKKSGKEWFRNPMNLALFAWVIVVAVSGAILFLVMTGLLNKALPKKSQRNTWFEVNNQILNALFTLMCLYQHPKRFHQLVMLLRWRPEDISSLRKIYCKNGTYKPHEWAHMLIVITLLHLNCFAQYALCGLNLGYKHSNRPAIGVGICISVAIAAPAIAGLYTIVSPLGKEYEYDEPIDDESQISITNLKSSERRLSFMRQNGDIIENNPEWAGGIFDFWDDISVAYLSLCCTFCVFGWNMEKLGFGNMYVHIMTFVLFCSSPFWIFNLAALNIDNEMVRQGLGLTGFILCALGLLYGGYWRIRMRNRFNLPGYTSCCGKPAVSDCFLWLCCCWCSLAQEVRTAHFYGIAENRSSRRDTDERTREGNSNPDSLMEEDSSKTGQVRLEVDFSRQGLTQTMTPPSPLLIEKDVK